MLSNLFAGLLGNPLFMGIAAAVIGLVLFLLSHFGVFGQTER